MPSDLQITYTLVDLMFCFWVSHICFIAASLYCFHIDLSVGAAPNLIIYAAHPNAVLIRSSFLRKGDFSVYRRNFVFPMSRDMFLNILKHLPCLKSALF